MEVKKKTFLENLRQKTKLVNLKRPGKKALAKQGRQLAHRRSISVPDLRFVPGEAFSTERALVSTASEGIFFGISPGVSDTDSIASGSIPDGPLFMDKLNDSVPETRLKVPTDHTAAALNRMSAPVERLTLYEEIDDMINSGSEKKVSREGEYAQVDKRAKRHVAKFTFDPVPAPRSIFANALAVSPRPDLVERESLSGEDAPADRAFSDTIVAALARASSLGEQANPYIEKKTISFEHRKSSSEKGTPPAVRGKAPADRMSLMLDTPSTPLESGDGTSLDSACGTPNEERVNMPWTTDLEELDREHFSPLFMKEFSMEEALLEEAASEEALEDIAEVSLINYMHNQRILFSFEVCIYCSYLKFVFRCQVSYFLSW